MSTSSRKKYILLDCCILLPRTTILLLIAGFVLLVNGIFGILGTSDLVPPEEWRWVVCALDLALGFGYFLWLIYLVITIKKDTRKGTRYLNPNRSTQKTYTANKNYANSLELQHTILGFFVFAIVGIIWAAWMGVQTNGNFLIAMNPANYIILKSFYLVSFILCFIMIGLIFNFPFDHLDLKMRATDNSR